MKKQIKLFVLVLATAILLLGVPLQDTALALTGETSDISSDAELILPSLAELALSADSFQAAIKDKVAYCTMSMNGILAADFTDPNNPGQVGFLSMSETVSLLAINGDYIYLPVGEKLYITDTALSQPIVLDIPFGDDDTPKGVFADSDRLYMLYGKSIRVFSLENPMNPSFITIFFPQMIDETAELTDMAVRDGMVYLINQNRIEVHNFSDPGNIFLECSYELNEGSCAGIELAGDYAYLGISDKKITQVLNIADIKNPVHYTDITDFQRVLAASNNMAFVVNGLGSLCVTDIIHYTETLKLINDKKAEAVAVPSENKIPVKTDKVAYITIDDGPDRNITSTNLETLKKYGIKATFFVLPRNNVDDIYKRIIDEGHVIGNHSYSHDYDYLYSNLDNFKSDVLKAHNFIKRKTGYTSTVFRFPGGSGGRSKDIIKKRAEVLADLGYRYFDWDVSTNDTDPNLKKYGSEEKIVNLLANNVLNNTRGKKKLIILMHDSAGKSYSAKALPLIIEGLQKQGYSFDVLTSY